MSNPEQFGQKKKAILADRVAENFSCIIYEFKNTI